MEILELLFNQTEKIAAWAGMVVLVVAITTMASCTQNADNNKQELLTMLIEKGYHPLVVNCVMEGWSNSDKKMFVCMEAFRKYPGQQEDVRGELTKTD